MAGTDGTRTGDQLDAVNSIIKIVDMFKRTPGATQTTTQTETGGGVSQESIDYQLKRLLAGAGGTAATALRGKNAGLFNASSNKILQGNLLAEAAGQGAKLGATAPVTRTSTTTTGGAPAKFSGQDALLGVLANRLVNSESGKKAIDGIGTLAESGISSAYDYIASQFAEQAATSVAPNLAANVADPLVNYFADAATEYATKEAGNFVLQEAGNSAATSSVFSNLLSSLGFAEGGRVPVDGIYSAKFTPKTVTAPGFYSRTGMAGAGVPTSITSTSDGSGNADYAPAEINYKSGAAMINPSANLVSSLASILGGIGLLSVPALAPAAQYFGPAFSLTGAKGSLTDTLKTLALEDLRTSAQKDAAKGRQDAAQYLADIGDIPGNFTTGAMSTIGQAGVVSPSSLLSLAADVAPAGPMSTISGMEPGGLFSGLSSSVEPAQDQSSSVGDEGGSAFGSDLGSYGDLSGEGPSGFAAKGGRIKGDQKVGVDDVPTMLDGGEFVLRTNAVKAIDSILGPDFLHYLNSLGARS